jgi:hypothetical protein
MTENNQYWEMAKDMTQTEIRYSLMRSSRDRWRSVAMALADEVYKRSPHLPDLQAFYELLHDPYDGDGLNV